MAVKAYFCSMNKKVIILIICLTTVAMLGLMSIQVYWIRNAILVKEAGFVRNVNEALSTVVFRLEKIEMAAKLKQHMRYNSPTRSFFNSIDSVNKKKFQNLLEISTRNDFEKFMQQSFLMQQIVEGYMGANRNIPVEKRIDKALLDSLINAELSKAGINTQYEYGIFSPAQNKMLMQKTGMFPAYLLSEKGFHAVLYPGEMHTNPVYLMLYFPKEKKFLISQMWLLLFVSAVLVLVIILSFFISINTVFKQKKLSLMKNDFINNMTHEFKTPISTIALACEALKDKDILKTETLYNNYIGIIGEENLRLKGMAEKVLQTALIEKGQLILKSEWVDIHEIIRETVKKIKLQAEKKQGRIFTDLQAGNTKIKVDKMHFTNVILNLLDNAIKYTVENPEILISSSENENGISIQVQDNGIGISKANQKKIFDKLYRVPSGNVHNFKGFGLGLSYVKAIINAHGGRISLQSDLNKGSTFKIFIPFTDIIN